MSGKLLYSIVLLSFMVLQGCKSPAELIFGEPKTEVTISATANYPTGRYNPLPTSVTITFPTTINMASVDDNDLTIADTCAASTATISNYSESGQVATLTLAGVGSCVNSETVTITIKYAKILHTSDEKRPAGTQSIVYTFDDTPPTVSATVSGTSGISTSGIYAVSTVPTSIVFNFSTDTDLTTVTADDFTIGASTSTDCDTPPTIGALTRNANTGAVTVALTGIDCADGQSFIITLAQDAAEDNTVDGSSGDPAPNTAPSADLEIEVVYYTSIGAVVSVGDGATSADGTFKIGDTIDIIITFDVAVNVSGTPRLLLDLTGTEYAEYVSGDGTTELLFQYTTVAGASTSDLDYDSTSALGLNGGSITRVGSGGQTDADLDLPSPGAANSLSQMRTIVIDASNPTLASKSPTGATNTWGISGRDVTFTMSEEIDVNSLADADLTVNAGTCATPPSVTAAALSGGSNEVLTFTLSANTCADGETYDLVFDPAEVTDIAGNAGSGAASSMTVTTETDKPVINVSVPSKNNINSAATLTYTLTYSGASAISLANGDIGFAGASTDCAANVSGTGLTTRTVTVSNCSADGSVQIDIAAETATNVYGNSADAVAEGDITDFNADNTALTDPTSNLPTIGANLVYNEDTSANFQLTFASDVLGSQGDVTNALSLSCDAGGGLNPVSITGARTSDTIMTITPNEASPDFVYNANCEISGSNVPDEAGNLHTFSAITFKVGNTPSGQSGPSGSVSLATATGAGHLGDVVFTHAMNTATVIVANVTLTCNGQDITLSSLAASVGDTTFNIDFDESDADWLALVGGESCALTFSTSVENSLGIPLSGAAVYNFTTTP